MLLENKEIAIIGAGPVGLTMAALLQRKGVRVRVYERDKNAHSRIWGGTLDLHEESGQKALAKAGILPDYYERAWPMGRILADTRGNILLAIAEQAKAPEINRTELRDILLAGLKDDTVIWDRKLGALEPRGKTWVLKFEGRPDAIADVVFVANGGMSNARAFVTDAKVMQTETFMVQGEVNDPAKNCPEFLQKGGVTNILMASGDGVNFVANPNNNGALTYSISFDRSRYELLENKFDFQDQVGVAAFLVKLLNKWDESYIHLIRSTPVFTGLPSRKFSLDQPWKNNRPLPITLIGDAAHLMPPFAGKGVNTGMLDALILSENLTEGLFGTLRSAIQDYENKMFLYAAEAQLETERNEYEMHRPDFSFFKRFSNLR